MIVFFIKQLILIIIKMWLVGYWESLIKEIKEPGGKFLRVWAKNQLWFEIFEKILKFTQKSQWKIDFLRIFSPIFQVLNRRLDLGAGGWFRGLDPGLGGREGLYKS